MFAVDGTLFFFGWETVAHRKGHFGAKQANALSAPLQGAHKLADEADVHPEIDAVAVAGGAGQFAQRFQLAGELFLFGEQLTVGFPNQIAGVDEHFAVVAVDDQGLAFDAVDGHVASAHDGGDAERVGDDGAVGIARTFQGDDGAQVVEGQIRHHGRGDLIGNQHGVFRTDRLLVADFLKIGEHALAKFTNVRRAFAQIGILHALEAGDLFQNRLLQSALGPLTSVNAVADVASEGGIIQHM